MTAKILTGAPFHGEVDWQAIEWRKVYQNVPRLQARIVKAIQFENWKVASFLGRLKGRTSAKDNSDINEQVDCRQDGDGRNAVSTLHPATDMTSAMSAFVGFTSGVGP